MEGYKAKFSGELKRALKHNRSMSERQTKRENCWGIYDSGLDNFQTTFFDTLPDSYRKSPEGSRPNSFRDYIEEKLAINKENGRTFTAIEFGGPGSNLFRGFSVNVFTNTVGVCLKDIRPEATREIDQSNNHFVVEGDMLDVRQEKSAQLISEVVQKLGTTKTDLIISKIDGAQEHINKDGAILDRVIRTWYNLLSLNGIMFVQFYFRINATETLTLVRKWATAVQERFPEIKIKVAPNGTMRLEKKSGSPEHLPPATQLLLSHGR